MEFQNQIQVYDEENPDIYSSIHKIINDGKQNKSFFICDINEIITKYNEWKSAFSNIEPFYAVRCNDSRIVLEIIAALGLGFSCVSKEEIRRILSLGVSPNKIIFSNTTKKRSHIQYAAREGVELLTFDNEEELHKIHKYHPLSKLILRVCTKESNDQGFFRKFGATPGEEVKRLLSTAKDLYLNVVGVVFYFNTPKYNNKEFTRAIETTKLIFKDAVELGYSFHIINIGGGCSENDPGDITNGADTVNKSLDEHFPGVTCLAEIGRYFVETAFKTASYIHSKRSMSDGIRMYYLDVGVYNGLAPVTYNKHSFNCAPLKKAKSEILYPSILWGPTCDSVDKISEDVEYLPKMNIGDWIVFKDTGAYTLPITFNFNRFPVPDLYFFISKKNWLFINEKATIPFPKSTFSVGNFIHD